MGKLSTKPNDASDKECVVKVQQPRFQTPPYRLTEQVLFRSWLMRLRSELEAYELLDIFFLWYVVYNMYLYYKIHCAGRGVNQIGCFTQLVSAGGKKSLET